MLYESQPSQLRELEELQKARTCWMCGHMKIEQGREFCSAAKHFLEEMLGMKFEYLVARVNQESNADNCGEFQLTEKPEVLKTLDEYIEDIRTNNANHADHYAYLRRPEHAY